VIEEFKMPELDKSEIKPPLIAPSFMHPRTPVLDEPLDIDGHYKKDSGPVVVEEKQDLPVEEIQSISEPIEEGLVFPEAVLEPVLQEPLMPEALGTDPEPSISMPEDPVDDDGPDEEIEVSPLEEAQRQPQNESAPRMTPLQRFIVALLIVLVVLLFATVFLYITSRVTLPPAVVETLESWFDAVLSILP
jgi:hypothetical protein